MFGFKWWLKGSFGSKHSSTRNLKAIVSLATNPVCEQLECRQLLSLSAPSGLVGARIAGNSVGLLWKDNSSEDHFVVERKASGGSYSSINSTVSQNATTFTDSTATPGTTYYYRIKATATGQSDSDYSNELVVTPTNLPTVPSAWSTQDVGSVYTAGSASETGGTFTMTSNSGDIGVYNTADHLRFAYIQVSGNFDVVVRVASESPNHDWAKAGLMLRESLSDTARDAAIVTTPYHGGRQQLQFFYPGGSYEMYDYPYSQSSGSFQPIWLRLTRTGDNFTARYSTNGTTWLGTSSGSLSSLSTSLYVGLAVSSNGVGNLNTATFDGFAFGTGPALSPENLSVSAASSTSVNLEWTDHATNETNYAVKRSTDNSTWTTLTSSLSANTTTYTDTSASAGTMYYYKVEALTPNVESTSVSVTTPPSTPGSLAADAGGRAHAVRISWSDVSGESSYVLERSSNGGSTWVPVAGSPIDANQTSYEDSGLSEGTSYSYRIKALNGGGASAFSSSASATTEEMKMFDTTLYANKTSDPIAAGVLDMKVFYNPGISAAQSQANAAYTAGVRYFVLDVENAEIDIRYNPSDTSHTGTDGVVANYIDYLDAIIAGTTAANGGTPDPSIKIGIYGDIPRPPTVSSQYNTTDATFDPTDQAQFDRWMDADDYLRGLEITRDGSGTITSTTYDSSHDLLSHVDFLLPSPYLADSDTTQWARVTSLINGEVARLDMPSYSFVDPRYVGSGEYENVPVSQDIWRMVLDTARLNTDGIVLWDGAPTNWDDNADWWSTVQDVLADSASAPSAPSALSVDEVGPTISWTDNSTDETSFVIERAPQVSGDFLVVGQVPANVTTWSDPNARIGSGYRYRVKAENGFGFSGYTSIATLEDEDTTRDAKQPQNATEWDAVSSVYNGIYGIQNTGDGYIGHLDGGTWAMYSNMHFDSDITEFIANIGLPDSQAGQDIKVFLRPVGTALGSTSNPVWTLTTASTSPSVFTVLRDESVRIPVIDAPDSGNYDVYVVFSGSGDGALHSIRFGNEVPPAPPVNVQAAIGDTGITVSWSPMSSGEDGFIVERATDPGKPHDPQYPGDWERISGSTPVTGTSFLDSPLPEGTVYYRVRSANLIDSVEYASDYIGWLQTSGLQYDATDWIQAEDFDASGAGTSPTPIADHNNVGTLTTGAPDNGSSLGFLDDGDWVLFSGVDFGEGQTEFTARLGVPSENAGGQIKVILDNPSNSAAFTLNIASTGSFYTFSPESISGAASGVHNVYLKFVQAGASGGSGLLNLDDFKFST